MTDGATPERIAALGRSYGQPWVYGLQSLTRPASSFHPNADGMQRVADATLDHLSR